jgi:hypothetical protein
MAPLRPRFERREHPLDEERIRDSLGNLLRGDLAWRELRGTCRAEFGATRATEEGRTKA